MSEAWARDWKELVAAGGSGQRMMDGHPLRLFYGASEVSKPLFFLMTETRPEILQMSNIVTVERGQRHDGSWTVVLTLQDPAYGDAFMGMCAELARRSRAAQDPRESLRIFYESLAQWRAILNTSPGQRLTGEQIRGLVAEMWFGLACLSDDYTPTEIVLAWQGPYGAPQDYRMPGGHLYEVKSIHAGSKTLEISSVEQLDPPEQAVLTLVTITVEEVDVPEDLTVSLPGLVREWRALLGGHPKAMADLDHRFAALGFNPLDDHYQGLHFTVGDPRFYEVAHDFPRLLRANVPLAVDRVSYTLRMAGAIPHERKQAPTPL